MKPAVFPSLHGLRVFHGEGRRPGPLQEAGLKPSFLFPFVVVVFGR
jgi:hypothetical protein